MKRTSHKNKLWKKQLLSLYTCIVKFKNFIFCFLHLNVLYPPPQPPNCEHLGQVTRCTRVIQLGAATALSAAPWDLGGCKCPSAIPLSLSWRTPPWSPIKELAHIFSLSPWAPHLLGWACFLGASAFWPLLACNDYLCRTCVYNKLHFPVPLLCLLLCPYLTDHPITEHRTVPLSGIHLSMSNFHIMKEHDKCCMK